MLGPSLHSLKKEAEKRGYRADYTARVLSVAEQLHANGVPVVFSLMHLAALSNTSWSQLRRVISRRIDSYRVFEIRKRSGGNRLICAPHRTLRDVQTWIHRRILVCPGAQAYIHKASTAYSSGSSILKNAERHSGATWMVKVDIKDFFESISERQVYYVFRKLGYPALLSFEMARLCTRVVPSRADGVPRPREGMRRWKNSRRAGGATLYGHQDQIGHLPQGAPTSAMLANLVVFALDERIQKIADEHGAAYTRYADDIVLSLGASDSERCRFIFNHVAHEIARFGFRINRVKSRVTGPGRRKIVTGLVINDSVPRLPKSVKDEVELAIYHIRVHGLLSHMERKSARRPSGYLNHLVGKILYCRSVEQAFGDRMMAELRHALMPYRDMLAMASALEPTPMTPDRFQSLHAILFGRQ